MTDTTTTPVSKGFAAIEDATLSEVTATVDGTSYSDSDIDTFELRASRRSLLNLRSLLWGENMLDLIGDQLDESDRRIRQYVADSHGEFTGIRVVLDIKGLKIAEFMPILRESMGAAGGSDEQKRQMAVDWLFEFHPEHYALAPEGAGVIETMGGLPTLSHPKFVAPDNVPAFVRDLIDPSYALSTVGEADLRDGTVFTYVLQEYRDTDEGLQASLRIWYPKAAPEAYCREHAEHYSVEFRNGVRIAVAQAKDATAAS